MSKIGKRKISKVEFIEILLSFGRKLKYDYVSCFAGNAALFILMSLFPMVMYCVSVFQYIPYDMAALMKYLLEIMPDSLVPFVNELANEAYSETSTAMQSVTILVTLFCASKGVYAIIIGMNAVYGIRETRNYVILYALAVGYMVALFGVLGMTMVLIVLGNTIFGALLEFVPAIVHFKSLFSVGKYACMLVILLLLLLLVYLNVPNRKSKLRYEIPGAFFATVVWLVFSSVFSFYIDNYAHYSATYGSLATIVIFILWLYGTMYIVFIGAEINVVLRTFAEYGYNYKRAYQYYKDEYEGDLTREKDILVRFAKRRK